MKIGFVSLGCPKNLVDGEVMLGVAKRLVVTGCLAERYREELKKEIPEIDAVLGTGEVEGIVDAIAGRDPLSAIRDPYAVAPLAAPIRFFGSSEKKKAAI